jgi:TetR/AcrR family transcriptional regulator, copper-responsive repressor
VIIILEAMNKATAPPRPRGRPRTFDRDAALERAMLLFWSRGYEATSVSDLTDAMGITPPSLYSAFGDKKRLFLEAVDRYLAGPGQFAQQALCEEPTAERAVRRLLMDSVDSFCDPSRPKGCMVVLAATNCTAESDAILRALLERRRMGERALRDRIAAGRAAGELQPGTDIDALTGFVIATLYGLSLKARDGASRSNMRKIVTQMMRAWPHAAGTRTT